MTNVSDMIAECRRAGLRLERIGQNTVRVRPRSCLTEHLRTMIVEHKSELIRILDAHGADQPTLEPPAETSLLLKSASAASGLSTSEILDGFDDTDLRRLLTGRITEPELVAFARARADGKLRESGRLPPHYTAISWCDGCGEVPI